MALDQHQFRTSGRWIGGRVSSDEWSYFGFCEVHRGYEYERVSTDRKEQIEREKQRCAPTATPMEPTKTPAAPNASATTRATVRGAANGNAASAAVAPSLKTRTVIATATKETDMGATLPANIDPTPLIEKYGPQRNDFDEIAREVASASFAIQQMRPTAHGKELADQLHEWDVRAMDFISAFDKEYDPILKTATEMLQRVRQFRSNTVDGAINLRKMIRERTGAYQLAVQRKIDDERRELERAQRERAEQDRAGQLADLRAREAQAQLDAQRLGDADAAAAEEAAREAERLAAEASEVASAPPVPAAVSTTALRERYAVAGQSGVKVFVRIIRTAAAAKLFFQYLCLPERAISVTIPQEKRNNVIFNVGGIELTCNFAGLRRSDVAIPGVDVTETVDTRTRR